MGLDPNSILVAVFPSNDFYRGRKATQDLNYRRAAFGENMPKGIPPGFRSLYIYRAYGWRIETKLKALFATTKKPADKKDESGWPDNLEALKLISELAHKNGLNFVVALLPHTWNF